MVSRKIYLLLFLLIYAIRVAGQDSLRKNTDSFVVLPDVKVTGYIQPQFQWQTPVSVSILESHSIRMQSVESMVPAMNTVPGVRMEERSPGSYRLSIRGSLVRSPYGVRNVKIYYNDFALTDAGGNTYLNVLSINNLDAVEILKGPDGSLFGANSGGVVLLKSNTDTLPALNINIYGGSYGLIGNSIYFSRNFGKHFFTVSQSFQRADGYRQNSAHHRFFLQVSDKWTYRPHHSLEAYLFYSDLAYKTPGGLTRSQYEENPRQARPPTATMPGSVEQKTRINTRMLFAGISHRARLLPFLSHTISLWGNHVDFIYPFITNYEIRKENNFGGRTHLTVEFQRNSKAAWQPTLDLGFEGSGLITDAYNYDNHAGVKGDLQAYHHIINHQYFPFLRGRVEWRKRLVIEAAVSLNFNGYQFSDSTHITNNFPAVWMPHIALSYQIINPLSVRLTFSRGYSTPTTAEVRPSDNQVHTDLHAEQGWNSEIGIRLNFLKGRILADFSGFHYLLEDGIISQVDSSGNTYFINSGRIRQFGIEFCGSWIIVPDNSGHRFFKKVKWNSSYTFSYFRYDRYMNGKNDFSGNRVAGVPEHVLVNSVEINFPLDFYLFLQHQFTSRIPLNDANSEYADPYHLLSAKIGFKPSWKSYFPSDIYLFFDNILNQRYSLGNDINAFGGRYYNAAAAFNFQIGFKWEI